jgi:hypothetical protein
MAKISVICICAAISAVSCKRTTNNSYASDRRSITLELNIGGLFFNGSAVTDLIAFMDQQGLDDAGADIYYKVIDKRAASAGRIEVLRKFCRTHNCELYFSGAWGDINVDASFRRITDE